MATDPSTTVRLIRNINFTDNYENVVLFSSEEEQTNHFLGLIGLEFSGHSYQRAEGDFLKVTASYDAISRYCYMMFRNSAHENKWWYAFIDEVVYINETTVGIAFHLDVMQSYMFRYTLGECFVEREHSATDEVGDNLIAESIYYGPYVYEGQVEPQVSDSANAHNESGILTMADMSVVLAYNPSVISIPSLLPALESFIYDESVYNGVYQGIKFLVIPVNQRDSRTEDNIKNLDKLLEAFDAISFDGFITMFMMPTMFLPEDDAVNWTNKRIYFEVERNATFDGYTPKNKKLFTWPYTCANLTSHRGGGNDFCFERFPLQQAAFAVECNLSTTPSAIAYPMVYSGKSIDVEDHVSIDSYPIVTWGSTGIGDWISNNLFQVALGAVTASSAISAAGAIAYHAPSTTILPAVGSTLSKEQIRAGQRNKDPNIAKYFYASANQRRMYADKVAGEERTKQAIGILSSITPAPATTFGSGAGGVLFGNPNGRVIAGRVKRITGEYARVVDNYFTVYGYACNEVKKPNLTSRPHWNYIKLRDVHLEGINCPMNIVDEITRVYEKGVTFWRPTSTIGDYVNQDNSV